MVSRFLRAVLATLLVCCGFMVVTANLASAAEGLPTSSSVKVAKSLELIRQVGPDAGGYEEAQAAVKQLSNSSEVTVFDILNAMRDSSPIAKNWLRSVASQVADRTSPKIDNLLAFFDNRKNDADARYLVYRWIVSADPERKETLLNTATDDPSLPLRYLAIAKLLDEAKQASENQPETAKGLLDKVLVDGRNPEQLRAAVDAYKELGVDIDLSKSLGMFADWYVVGPFSNVDGVGFDEAYEVEQSLVGGAPFSLESNFTGKSSSVGWKFASTDDSMGSVDLNPIFENEKEAVSYAFCKFSVDSERSADARLGSIGANKVWVESSSRETSGKLLGLEIVAITNVQHGNGGRLPRHQTTPTALEFPVQNLPLFRLCTAVRKPNTFVIRWSSKIGPFTPFFGSILTNFPQ